MTITGMSEQWITTRIKEKGECKCISWDALKDLILTYPDETKKVDVFALSLYGLMVFPRALGYVDKATTGLFYRLSKKVTFVPTILAETFRSLGACRRAGAAEPAVKGCGMEGSIDDSCYTPLLVLRQHGLRQFILATFGLVQSEFMYRGADYKRKVSEISSAWNKTCRLKGVVISLATPRSTSSGEGVFGSVAEREEKAKAEYWERKFQEMQSQNLALDEENKGLKTKVTELGRSLCWHRNHDPTVELKELKSKVEDLEVAFHDGELRIEQLEAR
ncbi:hypothetical protein PVK06_047126 [Gossypium arboreum]|uniref:DUF7745 domain-containing protein n=1 Tax=Gossypium arboreum TaxID=29729 RepID=A0ABR0MCK6_GOSAR|nr:hypothetical protein PVK06_047126 [Gossypium arboreum]